MFFPSIVSRKQALALLRTQTAALAQRFGVVELTLFGSFARDHVADEGDVDVLVSFDSPPDWKRYFGAQVCDVNGVLWSITRNAIPQLLPALRNLLTATERDHP